METNGHPKPPAVAIFWDDDKKIAGVQFDREQAKNWSFVKALLGMAQDAVEQQMKMDLVLAAQQQQQGELLARKVLRPH